MGIGTLLFQFKPTRNLSKYIMWKLRFARLYFLWASNELYDMYCQPSLVPPSSDAIIILQACLAKSRISFMHHLRKLIVVYAPILAKIRKKDQINEANSRFFFFGCRTKIKIVSKHVDITAASKQKALRMMHDTTHEFWSLYRAKSGQDWASKEAQDMPVTHWPYCPGLGAWSMTFTHDPGYGFAPSHNR